MNLLWQNYESTRELFKADRRKRLLEDDLIDDELVLERAKSIRLESEFHYKKPSSGEEGGSSMVISSISGTHVHQPSLSKSHSSWKLYRVIQGHIGWVRTVDVDSSNEWFVTGSNDRMIKIWDLASGNLKLTLTGHTHAVRVVRCHPTLKYLFSAGEDNTVKCWDLETNKVARHYHGHLSAVYSMDVHPSLHLLMTGSRDATVRVWDIRTKVCVHMLAGHTNTVSSIMCQREEPQVVSGSMDQTVRLWDLASGKCSVTLTHHKKSIRSLVSHPRLSLFASCSADAIKVWKNPYGEFERNIRIPQNMSGIVPNCSAIRHDAEVFVSGCDDGSLNFYDWSSGVSFQQIKHEPVPGSLPGENGIFSVAFDKTGLRLITAECDKTIKMYKEDNSAKKTSII